MDFIMKTMAACLRAPRNCAVDFQVKYDDTKVFIIYFANEYEIVKHNH